MLPLSWPTVYMYVRRLYSITAALGHISCVLGWWIDDHDSVSRNLTKGRCCPDAGLMAGHRLRLWPRIRPASGQRFVFAGSLINTYKVQGIGDWRQVPVLDHVIMWM